MINELRENYAIITMHGNREVYIENFVSIIELDESKIRIRAKKELLTLEGSKLLVEYMTATDIKITGAILCIRIVEVMT